MSNCDKMLDIEKVKMFDKIADMVKKVETADRLEIFSNLNIISSNIRILSTSLINYQRDLSSSVDGIFDITYFDAKNENIAVLEIVRNFISDIRNVYNDFLIIEDKIEKKIQSLK